MGRIVPATVVDHIIPHKGDQTLMWDESNFQSLCSKHHNIKTAREDSGFGHGQSPRAYGGCGVDGMPTDPRHPWSR